MYLSKRSAWTLATQLQSSLCSLQRVSCLSGDCLRFPISSPPGNELAFINLQFNICLSLSSAWCYAIFLLFWFIQRQKTYYLILFCLYSISLLSHVLWFQFCSETCFMLCIYLTGQSWKNYPTILHVMSLVWWHLLVVLKESRVKGTKVSNVHILSIKWELFFKNGSKAAF